MGRRERRYHTIQDAFRSKVQEEVTNRSDKYYCRASTYLDFGQK